MKFLWIEREDEFTKVCCSTCNSKDELYSFDDEIMCLNCWKEVEIDE